LGVVTPIAYFFSFGMWLGSHNVTLFCKLQDTLPVKQQVQCFADRQKIIVTSTRKIEGKPVKGRPKTTFLKQVMENTGVRVCWE
jgi:hypothetical protein